ncbi:SPRY domain-containing protein, partial [Saccharophagus degradans]
MDFKYAPPQGFGVSQVEDWDNDGLSDKWELEHFGNLAHVAKDDSDFDGLANNSEVLLNLNPADGIVDSDSDGMADYWEFQQFKELGQAGSDDYDQDGMTNLDEFNAATYLNVSEPANYWNSSKTHPAMTLSDENKKIVSTSNTFITSIARAPLYPGKKYYWEVTNLQGASSLVGIAPANIALDTHMATEPNTYALYNNGSVFNSQSSTENAGPSFPAGSTVMLAYDPSAGKMWFGVNGVWSGNPAEGTGALIEGVSPKRGLFYPAISQRTDQTLVAFTAIDFKYAVPEGFGPTEQEDWDKDGLSDAWELQYFGDLTHIAGADADGDGLLNAIEAILYLNPTDGVADTDNDGLTDVWEYTYFKGLESNAAEDADLDGFTNLEEFTAGTDPTEDELANYWNESAKSAYKSLSEDNTKVESSSNDHGTVIAKYPLGATTPTYWEVEFVSGANMMVGIVRADAGLETYLTAGPHSYGAYLNGNISGNQIVQNNAGPIFSAGQRVMLAFNPNTGRLWVGVNGVWQGNPAAGTGALFDGIDQVNGPYYPAVSQRADITIGVFAKREFKYTPPAGFFASAKNAQ